MSAKTENILRKILFIAGLILFLFSLGMLIYEIIDVLHIDWSKISTADERNEMVTYLVVLFTTYAFKIVLSLYAINALRHLDEVIDPLFTFTILYTIFVIFQTVIFFHTEHKAFTFSINAANNAIDIIVAAFMIVITLIFKIDDWRTYEKGVKK